MEEIEYPLYVPCDKINWAIYENSSNKILGLPNDEKETYSKPFKDVKGQIYFIVDKDVSEIFKDESGYLSQQITFLRHDQINWPTLL